MLIKEVCRACEVTRKAVEYYERQGLIHPQILENGYRNYEDPEITALKELSVLRKCGIGMQDLRLILESSDRQVALARYRYRNELQMQKLRRAQSCIDELIKCYDINEQFKRLLQEGEELLTVQEKLLLAFPGNYGIYVSLHFGRFLGEPIRTDEQRAAYGRVVAYLDQASDLISDELGGLLESVLPFGEDINVKGLESAANGAMEKALQDPASYFEKDSVEAYLEFRRSDAFKNSQAGRLYGLLCAFQKASGYQEIFLENMKMLSPAYQSYCKRLEDASACFYERYPLAKEIYENHP